MLTGEVIVITYLKATAGTWVRNCSPLFTAEGTTCNGPTEKRAFRSDTRKIFQLKHWSAAFPLLQIYVKKVDKQELGGYTGYRLPCLQAERQTKISSWDLSAIVNSTVSGMVFIHIASWSRQWPCRPINFSWQQRDNGNISGINVFFLQNQCWKSLLQDSFL